MIQIPNIRNGKNDMTIHSVDSKRIRDNYEQLYVNKFDNLDEKWQIPRKTQITKATQKNIGN